MVSTPVSELPDPFLFHNGARVQTPAQWGWRRREVHAAMVPLAYGNFPPAPRRTECVELHAAVVKRLGGARLLSYRVETDGEPAFAMRLFVPAHAGLLAVIVNGDGCWHYASDAVIAAMLERGYGFAQFNRVELASDGVGGGAQHNSRVFRGRPVAALAAWAWGYHRAVDALGSLPIVDPQKLAVVGHSRGGKAALLAGATDERVAVTSANNSGAGGAGCFRWQGPESETLADIVAAFPYWFGPQLRDYADRVHELPFDQHFLKALVAPRALLTTEARDDLWANPQGTWQTHRAAREVYAFLGAQERIATVYRDGGHEHNEDDWHTLLDFCDDVFQQGAAGPERSQVNPYPDLPPAHQWRRPMAA